MNKLSLTGGVILAASVMTGFANAEEITFKSCTADGHSTELTVDLKGGVEGNPSLADVVRKSFDETARGMSAAQLRKNDPGAIELQTKIEKALENRKVSEDTSISESGNRLVIGEPNSCTLK